MINFKIKKTFFLALFFAIWLTIPNIMVLTSSLNLILQELVFLLVVFLYVIKFGVNFYRISPLNLFIYLLFIFAILFSLIFNIEKYAIFLNLINFLIFFYFIAVFCEKSNDLVFLSFKIYSVINIVLLSYFIFLNLGNTGLRGLVEGVQPNYIGLICLTVALTAILFFNVKISLPIIFVSLYYSYVVSSRTTMICITLLLILYLFNILKDRKGLLIFVLFLLFISIIFNYKSIYVYIIDLLMLDDSYRGVGTGFSGRSDRWGVAFEIIEKNPLFGIGFKEGEKTLGFTTDNGYISVLLEMGVYGLFCYLITFVTAFFISLRYLTKYIDKSIVFSSIVLIVFMFYCFFEQRYINFGNALSYIVFFSLLYILNLSRN